MNIKEGCRVYYTSPHGSIENGIVKSIGQCENAFVVFNCNNDWDNYKKYTACNVDIGSLVLGWFEQGMITKLEYDSAKEKLKELDHERCSIEYTIVQYELQEKLRLKKEKDEHVKNCGEHYYISSGGKWSSATQMTCQECGHVIG